MADSDVEAVVDEHIEFQDDKDEAAKDALKILQNMGDKRVPNSLRFGKRYRFWKNRNIIFQNFTENRRRYDLGNGNLL